MTRFLDRLERSIRWQLLAPPRCLPFGAPAHRRAEHAQWLARLKATRAEVFGVGEAPIAPDSPTADESAAHLIAVDARDHIVGGLRLFLVDRRQQSLTAGLLASFGRIRFPDEATARFQLSSLDEWLVAQPFEPRFVYGGGLFISPAWHHSGLGMALGMAAVAWTRLHGSRMSVSFASVEGTVAQYFELLGAKPVTTLAGQPLPPFKVPGYDIRVRIVHFDTASPHPNIETGVQAMQRRLASMQAMAPSSESATVDLEVEP